MSRQQRRVDRKSQPRNAAPPPSRRTPVRAAGGRQIPWVPIAVAGGVLAVGLLIAYLVFQSGGSGANADEAQKRADDPSSSIPGTFVPGQGRGHFPGTFSQAATPMPFCPGVPKSDTADAPRSTTPNASTTAAAGTATPQATATTAASATSAASTTAAADTTPQGTATVPTDCRSSNPPSSGKHLNVQRNVDVGGGNVINIPADPDVYPSDVEVPRDAIPHILEHAGVFVGYNCADGDQACQDVVDQLTSIVNARIDNNKNRVVMAHDSDLPVGTIGMSSWARVETFDYKDFTKDRVQTFISKNACRVDFEGFCK